MDHRFRSYSSTIKKRVSNGRLTLARRFSLYRFRIYFISTNTISTRLWICLAENVQIIILRPEYLLASPRFILESKKKKRRKREILRIEERHLRDEISNLATPRHGEEEEEEEKPSQVAPRLILEFVGSQHSCRRGERVIASNPWRKALNPADWPRVFICMRGFRLLYELTVERHIRHGRRFAFQPVTEKAIVNDRWTSNGQHVLHTTAHKTYAYVSTAPEKKTPFCLNERGAPSLQSGRGTRHLHFFCAVGRGKYGPDEFFSGNGEVAEKWPLSPSRVPPPLFLRLKRNESGNGSGWWRWFSSFCFFGMFEDVELFPSPLFFFLPWY